MKKILACGMAVLSVAIMSCNGNQTKTEETQKDSLVDEKEIVVTSEDSIARGEALMLTEQIAEKMALNDAASVTDLINQTEAAVKMKMQDNEEGQAAFAAAIKTFLDKNKQKLDELSVSTANIIASINDVPGVQSAIDKVKAAEEEARKAAMKAAAEARKNSQEAVQTVKQQATAAAETAKSKTNTAVTAAKEKAKDVAVKVEQAAEVVTTTPVEVKQVVEQKAEEVIQIIDKTGDAPVKVNDVTE